MRVLRSTAAGGLAVLAAAGADAGVMLGFEGLTNNRAADVAVGVEQFSVETLWGGAGVTGATFVFRNEGPAASSIADVYFDDGGALFGGLWVDPSSAGVSFSEGAKPKNLPGGKKHGFAADWSADADAPVAHQGIDPGESLTLTLSLLEGRSLLDVFDALESGALTIGIHAQAFGGGGSESFVNRAIPAASTGAAVAGVGGLACASRRRRSS